MEPLTRQRYNNYVSRIAELNNTTPGDVTSTRFSVEPAVQQTLVSRMQESVEFLSRINIVPVTQLKGQKLGLSMGGPIGRNVDTASGKRRKGIDPTGLSGTGYECFKNNFDTALPYAKLDSWALFPEFETRIRDLIVRRQALDRICVGWNGISWQADSDIEANKMLEDFNRGWLQAIREDAPERVTSEIEGGKIAGKVTFGTDGDYDSLDAMVWDAKETLLPVWNRENPDLVVIVGSELLHDKYYPLINRQEGSLDMLARRAIMADKELGGLPAARVPYFPSDAFLITTFDNLSIYQQQSGQRRQLKDEPEYDQVTDYQSSNDAYVVEDYELVALVENIQANYATAQVQTFEAPELTEPTE